jgi:hypothetical protein
MPALACCVLYATAAVVLRDPLFVYVFVAGITLAGLLILVDRDVARFWEIAAPATLLVVLGLGALHAERAFPESEGPFSRRRFGLAFFWCGQALLAAGLLLLLGSQLFGWMYTPLAEWFNLASTELLKQRPEIVTDPAKRVLAIVLVLAGTYAYFYSDLVVRRVGVYIYFAIFTILWAEVLLVNLLGLENVTLELVIAVLAVTALAANLLQAMLTRQGSTFARSGPPLGLFLSTLPVVLGLVLHLRATNLELNRLWPYTPGWGYVGAMLATAVACRLGAYVYRHTMPWLSAVYFFGTAAATLVGAAGLLVVIGLQTRGAALAWDVQAPLLMLIPIAYLAAARLYRGHTAEAPLIWVGHTATGVMIFFVLVAAAHVTAQVFEPISGHPKNLWLAVFFAEGAVFYGLAAAWQRHPVTMYLATAAACAAFGELLYFWQVGADYYTLIFAVLGLLLLVAYRFAALERFTEVDLARAAFHSANALMSVSFVAAALLSLGRLALSEEVRWSLVGLLTALTVLSLLAAWLVQQQGWRRWYVIMAITEGLLTLLALHVLSGLTAWQKLEVFCVVAGLALLVAAHLGWYREGERQSDLVSLGLVLGSVLTGLPLVIAVLIYRLPPSAFSVPNELVLLAAGVVLLGSGYVFQLKATTITGAALLTFYLLTLVLFIHKLPGVQTAALWIALGGAIIFGAGLLLSIYRDRLLSLPDRVRRRAGVFRVLGWR